MSFHVKKEVKFGPKYVEHIYGSNPETWSGTWMKVGHDVGNSPTTFSYLCLSCQMNSKWRTQVGKILIYISSEI